MVVCLYCFVLVTIGPAIGISIGKGNPHQPLLLTWQVIHTGTGDLLNSTSKETPLNTWFPELHIDLYDLFPIEVVAAPVYRLSSFPTAPAPFPIFGRKQFSSGPNFVQSHQFYVCLGHIEAQARKCGGPTDYFCSSWSCVSTGDISWAQGFKDDLITVSRTLKPESKYLKNQNKCNPVVIKFTDKG